MSLLYTPLVNTVVGPDPHNRDLIAVTTQDCEPVLEQNKILRTMEQKSDWGRHRAQIPNNIINKWLNEEWARGNKSLRLFSTEWKELVWRKLQDPDWKYLKVDK